MSMKLYAHPFSSYCQKVLIALYENGGDAECKLQWSYPGQPKQIIPQSQLFPAASYTLTVNNGGGDGSYTAGTQVHVKADVPPVDEEFVGPFPSWKNVKDFSYGSNIQ